MLLAVSTSQTFRKLPLT